MSGNWGIEWVEIQISFLQSCIVSVPRDVRNFEDAFGFFPAARPAAHSARVLFLRFMSSFTLLVQ